MNFKNERGTNFLLLTDESITTTHFSERKTVFMLEGAPTNAKDICPGCAEDFKRWFGQYGKCLREDESI